MLNFNMDLQKQDNFSKAFTARQGDAGEQFSVTLFDNQVPYVPASGDVVSLRVVTPSGKFASVAGTMSGNKATFTLNGQITSEAGYYQRAYVAVSNGTKLRTTQDLIFFSLGNSDINKGQADYYVAELDKLLQQLNEEFDEWLAEREQDYSDLLARIVALTNRVTGLEQDVQDLIDAIQANRINTTNVFNSSLINQPESEVRRRVNGQTIEVGGWGLSLVNNTNTIAMFEPNKTYHAKYVAELLTLTGGDSNLNGHFGMCLYSGKTGFPTVWIVNGLATDVNNLKVGDKVTLEKTFTTPTELHNPEANYQILSYGRRDNTGVIDKARLYNVMIQEGSIFTGYQNNPDNELTKFDKERLKQNLHPDPLMTGTLPIKNKDTAIEISWDTNGWLTARNTDTAELRRFWYDPTNELNIPADSVTRPLAIAVRLRATLSSTIMIGYSSGENITYTSTGGNDWVWVTGIIKPTGSTGVSVYISPNANCIIDAFNIYFADITQSSSTLNTIEQLTLGTPTVLTNPDANTLTSTGKWQVYQGTNMPPKPIPTSSYIWWFEVIRRDTNNCIQFATIRSATPAQYYRQRIDGTWQEWRKVLDIASDGRVDTYAVDFNTLVESGSFVNTSATNSPTGAASSSWYVEVIRYGSSGNYILQRCTQISNSKPYTYQRQLFNGTWSDWQKITTDLSYLPVEDAGATKDLNNFGTTSEFMIYNPINAPTPNLTWYVEVKGYNSTYCKQTATSTGAADNTYTRQKVNNVWTPWRLITKTTV